MKKTKVIFFFLIFFLPTQLGRHFWPSFSFVSGVRVDFLAPTIFFTDLLVLVFLLSFFLKRKEFKPPLIFLALAVYLFLVSFLAESPPLSFLKLLKVIEFFLLGFCLFKSGFFPSVGWPLSLAVFYQSLIGLGQFLKGHSLGGFFWWLGERPLSLSGVNIALGDLAGRVFLRPYATFSHPNSLAGFFAVSLFLIAQDKKLPLWWKTMVVALGVIVLILSFSRVAWLASLIALLFVFLKMTRTRKLILAIFLIFCFLITTLGLPLYLIKVPLAEVQQRIDLAQKALAMIKERPFLGVGLAGFIPALTAFWQGKVYLLQPVHNLFLLVASETGLFGLMFFFFFWRTLFSQALHHRFLLGACLVVFFTGLFDHYWLTLQQNQLLLTLLAAWIFWLPKEKKMS